MEIVPSLKKKIEVFGTTRHNFVLLLQYIIVPCGIFDYVVCTYSRCDPLFFLSV